MKYDIYISDVNKTKVLQFPIIPAELPTLDRSISNEGFTTYWNGDYNFIEKPGLLCFSIESWWPTHKYAFARSTNMAIDFITLINSAIDNTQAVIMLITCSDGSTYLNDTFSIDSFKYGINNQGNYTYSIDFKQWRNYNV